MVKVLLSSLVVILPILGRVAMLVTALCNQKGGVGKTTTALNMARAAHRRALRTLVVDLDPQANTTTTLLGANPEEGSETLADLLSPRSDATLGDVVVKTGWSGVDVVPSGADVLADVGGELVTLGPGREHCLREALATARADQEYQLVLLDCPPALDQLTINGLTAAHRGVVVTSAALWSNDGIARLLRTVDAVRRYNNPVLEIIGVIVNAFEARTRRQRHWFEELLESGPAPVWQPPVPKATWIAEAVEAGVGLDEFGTPAAAALAQTYEGYLTRLLESAR